MIAILYFEWSPVNWHHPQGRASGGLTGAGIGARCARGRRQPKAEATANAWLGATLCFLVLGIAAGTTRDENILRAAYTSIHILDVIPVRPLAIGTAATGIIIPSLTKWGLFRFYWIIAKQVLTALLIALGVVVLNRALGVIIPIITTDGLDAAQNPAYQANQVILLSYLAAVVALLSASVVISVFKPFGKRHQPSERYIRQVSGGDRSLKTADTQE